jgi:serine/threonine protein kinase
VSTCPATVVDKSNESDKIVRLLGQGTFGKVVEARNIENRRKVAIKVIRAVQKYRDASKIEIRVLETLRRSDPTNSKYVDRDFGYNPGFLLIDQPLYPHGRIL